MGKGRVDGYTCDACGASVDVPAPGVEVMRCPECGSGRLTAITVDVTLELGPEGVEVGVSVDERPRGRRKR